MFEENDYLYDYDDDGLGDLDRSEDENEEIDEEERGVTDLIDDEEQEKKFEEQWKYEDYPNIDGIYNEGKDIEEVPEKYTPEQIIILIKTNIYRGRCLFFTQKDVVMFFFSSHLLLLFIILTGMVIYARLAPAK